jgi:crotonobetainyl-CoA:carnitine CoA-transferase CaiB-like acyl-CoA transferase
MEPESSWSPMRRFSFSMPTVAGPAVSIGADSQEILSGLLGLTDEQIEGLQRQGILARS